MVLSRYCYETKVLTLNMRTRNRDTKNVRTAPTQNQPTVRMDGMSVSGVRSNEVRIFHYCHSTEVTPPWSGTDLQQSLRQFTGTVITMICVNYGRTDQPSRVDHMASRNKKLHFGTRVLTARIGRCFFVSERTISNDWVVRYDKCFFPGARAEVELCTREGKAVVCQGKTAGWRSSIEEGRRHGDLPLETEIKQHQATHQRKGTFYKRFDSTIK